MDPFTAGSNQCVYLHLNPNLPTVSASPFMCSIFESYAGKLKLPVLLLVILNSMSVLVWGASGEKHEKGFARLIFCATWSHLSSNEWLKQRHQHGSAGLEGKL
jgi:hypothetical protein